MQRSPKTYPRLAFLTGDAGSGGSTDHAPRILNNLLPISESEEDAVPDGEVFEDEPPGAIPDRDTSPLKATRRASTVEYVDEEGNRMRFHENPNGLRCVLLFVNDQLMHTVGAVDYNERKGTIWTRPRVPHGGGMYWLGGTIPVVQRQQVVYGLWSLVRRMIQMKKCDWYGDCPSIDYQEVVDRSGLVVTPISTEIILNVYDLSKTTGMLNDAILRKFQLGMYHVGVEVYGTEYSFEHYARRTSGIHKCWPKSNKSLRYVYKESLHLGHAAICKRDLEELVDQLQSVWLSDLYHFTHCNCLTFASVFSKAIGAQIDIPLWITNACDVSKSSVALDFIADNYWKWVKSKYEQKTIAAQSDDDPFLTGGVSSSALHGKLTCEDTSEEQRTGEDSIQRLYTVIDQVMEANEGDLANVKHELITKTEEITKQTQQPSAKKKLMQHFASSTCIGSKQPNRIDAPIEPYTSDKHWWPGNWWMSSDFGPLPCGTCASTCNFSKARNRPGMEDGNKAAIRVIRHEEDLLHDEVQQLRGGTDEEWTIQDDDQFGVREARNQDDLPAPYPVGHPVCVRGGFQNGLTPVSSLVKNEDVDVEDVEDFGDNDGNGWANHRMLRSVHVTSSTGPQSPHNVTNLAHSLLLLPTMKESSR